MKLNALLFALSAIVISNISNAQLQSTFENDVFEIKMGQVVPTENYLVGTVCLGTDYLIETKIALSNKKKHLRVYDPETLNLVSEGALPDLGDKTLLLSIAEIGKNYYVLYSKEDSPDGNIAIYAKEIDPKTSTYRDGETILIDMSADRKKNKEFLTITIAKFFEEAFQLIVSEDRTKFAIYYSIAAEKVDTVTDLGIHVFDENLRPIAQTLFPVLSYERRGKFVIDEISLTGQGDFFFTVASPMSSEKPDKVNLFEDQLFEICRLKPGADTVQKIPIILKPKTVVRNVALSFYSENNLPYIAGCYQEMPTGGNYGVFAYQMEEHDAKINYFDLDQQLLAKSSGTSILGVGPKLKDDFPIPSPLKIHDIYFTSDGEVYLVFQKRFVEVEIALRRVDYGYYFNGLILIKVEEDQFRWVTPMSLSSTEVGKVGNIHMQMVRDQFCLIAEFDTKALKKKPYYLEEMMLPDRPYSMLILARFDPDYGSIDLKEAFPLKEINKVTTTPLVPSYFFTKSDSEFIHRLNILGKSDAWFNFTYK